MTPSQITNKDAPLLAGIEIGGTKLQLVVGDAQGRIIDRRRASVEPSLGAAGILSTIDRELDSLMKGRRIRAIGAGYGGPVDWRNGRIVRSYHVAGWDGFELDDWLRDLTGLPAVIDNDANVAALAESRCGAGRSFESVVYVTLGSGVGAGFCHHGRIYHGAVPGELELGHVRLDDQGVTVQDRCSGWAVDAIIRHAVSFDPLSKLAALWRHDFAQGAKQGGESRLLARAIAQNCPLAQDIIDTAMRRLALALSHVVHLLHPEAIVIGGGLSLVGEPLLESLRRHLPAFVMDAFAPGPRILSAKLGEDVVPAGALMLAGSV